MQLEIDHVMFPVYANNSFLETIESIWAEKEIGKVTTQPQKDFLRESIWGQAVSMWNTYRLLTQSRTGVTQFWSLSLQNTGQRMSNPC